MAKKHRIDKQTIKKRILPTLLFATLLPLILCISIPIDLFANNYGELFFSFSDFFPYSILFFFIGLAFCFLVLIFLPNKAYRIVSGLLITLSLLFFIQSNFLNGKFNYLGGDNMGIAKPSYTQQTINFVVWVVLLTAGCIILPSIADKKGIVSIIALVVSFSLLAAHIITPVSSAITKSEAFLSRNERLKATDKNAKHKVLSSKNIENVYAESNIYYFVVDRFDERFAETTQEVLPNIYDNFTGFTWFQDNISNYGHTYPAVANMLTNKAYNPELYRLNYLIETYKGENPLTELHDNGYEVNIYTPAYYGYSDAYYLPEFVGNRENVESYKITNHFMLSWKLFLMGLYRAAPLLFKNFFSFDSDTLNFYVEEKTSEHTPYSTAIEYTENLAEQELSLVDGKGFQFIHLAGFHPIYRFSDKENIKIYSQICFNFINKYLDFLKENDLYEEATIIITGDHAMATGDLIGLEKECLTALFFKPSGKNEEPLSISKAQTSHKNIWASIMDSAHIESETDYGKSIFEIPENENQVRTFEWHTQYIPFTVYEYEITGAGIDFKNNWKMVKKTEFPNRKITD